MNRHSMVHPHHGGRCVVGRSLKGGHFEVAHFKRPPKVQPRSKNNMNSKGIYIYIDVPVHSRSERSALGSAPLESAPSGKPGEIGGSTFCLLRCNASSLWVRRVTPQPTRPTQGRAPPLPPHRAKPIGRKGVSRNTAYVPQHSVRHEAMPQGMSI